MADRSCYMTAPSDIKAWYLVYTKAQQERVALDNLQRQGYEAYLPLFQKRIRRGKSFYQRIEPLFPRYLFIYLSVTRDNWAPIRSTSGVASLVRFGMYPLSVPDFLVQALRENEQENGYQNIKGRGLRPGDPVRFIDGALSGYQAIFQSKTSAERVVVLMEIAGQHTRITIDSSSVEACSPEH